MQNQACAVSALRTSGNACVEIRGESTIAGGKRDAGWEIRGQRAGANASGVDLSMKRWRIWRCVGGGGDAERIENSISANLCAQRRRRRRFAERQIGQLHVCVCSCLHGFDETAIIPNELSVIDANVPHKSSDRRL